MSERMIEDELKQLAEGWPGKSVAAEVSSRLDASPMDRSRSKSMAYQPRSSMRVYPLISAIVSAAALILPGFFLISATNSSSVFTGALTGLTRIRL